VNKLWEEGLGCREHINEYDDSHQTFMSMYTFTSIMILIYFHSLLFLILFRDNRICITRGTYCS
jgi:hypothetical protein